MHLYLRGTQGVLGHLGRCGVGHFRDQAVQPRIQLVLDDSLVLRRPNVFALQHLQVVRDARGQEDVRQARIDAAIRSGIRIVVELRTLRRVGREEHRKVLPLVMAHRDEPEVGALKLQRLADGHLRRNLHLLALPYIIHMHGQVFYLPAGLRATDLHAPAVAHERFDHVRRKQEGGIAPQVLVVVRSLHVLSVIERFHGVGVRAIWQARHIPRKAEAHIARVLCVAERVPLDIIRRFHVGRQVGDLLPLLHGVFPEELRTNVGQERTVRRGSHLRRILQ